MREEDLLCRYGGEEFLFFLTSLKSKEEAYIITERLRQKISEYYFEGQEVQPRHNLTMSFGITNFTKEAFKSPETITKNAIKRITDEADMALAVAKGKRKETSVQKEASESDNDRDKISVFKDKPLKKPTSADVIVSHGLVTPGKAEREAGAKNTISIFNGTADEKMIKTEIIPPDLLSNAPDRRKFRRFQTSNLVIYSDNGNEKVTKAVDLSLGGAKIRTEEKLSDVEMFSLIFILGDRTFRSKGDLVHSAKEWTQAFYYSGLKFKGVTPQDRGILQDYLTQLCIGKGGSTEK
jgi:hypothetical protein